MAQYFLHIHIFIVPSFPPFPHPHIISSNRLLYIGTNTANHALVHTPGLDPEAAEWIVTNRLVVGMGLDALSMDPGQSQQFGTHRVLLDRNMFIIENINSNLDKVPLTGAKVNIFPLNLQGASGSPCRVIVDTSFATTTSLSNFLTYLVIAFLAFVNLT